jgi:hypothetical protein
MYLSEMGSRLSSRLSSRLEWESGSRVREMMWGVEVEAKGSTRLYGKAQHIVYNFEDRTAYSPIDGELTYTSIPLPSNPARGLHQQWLSAQTHQFIRRNDRVAIRTIS